MRLFFSLHKLFPFNQGGVLKIHNPNFMGLSLQGSESIPFRTNHHMYDFDAISNKRNFQL